MEFAKGFPRSPKFIRSSSSETATVDFSSNQNFVFSEGSLSWK